MIFPSVSFLFFFFPLFLFFYGVFSFRNATLLAFSLLFYTWGEGIYLLVLLATIGINHCVGKRMEQGPENSRKALLGVGICLNLLLLGYFKYVGFLLADVLALEVAQDSLPRLPLGISFFTFQSMSYLIDVYRRDAQPARNVFETALYISMFPQLVAGPIVRYASVAETIRQRSINGDQIFQGILLFLFGLCQKVLIANNAAEIADAAYGLPLDQVSNYVAWSGALAYTLQIFFDFAGYSNMAIGLGLMMGFRFPANFNYPYISKSVTEFWRRWHISLSSWFRDYLYIPLGGNRHGALRTYCNLFIVFFLCGLWHGASWIFILWGMYHGSVLVIERLGLARLLHRLPTPISHIYTLLLIICGWVIFRSESLDQMWVFFQSLFMPNDIATVASFNRVMSYENLLFCIIGVILSTPIARNAAIALKFYDANNDDLFGPSQARLVTAAIVGSLVFGLCAIYILSGTYNPFIYFRF